MFHAEGILLGLDTVQAKWDSIKFYNCMPQILSSVSLSLQFISYE